MHAAPPDERPDPLWFKDAIIYELHVKTFFDSNGDGVGDFRGLVEKLDYLQDLGVTAIWLLPFYPSPLRDDGYDISDYWSVNEQYGSLRDFKRFLREAHRRGLRVITELVLNHTSDQHEWFQRARRSSPGSRWRNFYVWSDDPDRYKDTRIIFKDFESSNWSWDPVAGQYYWHRFYSHQPDLNFDNPEVQREALRVVDFWMEMGIDGLRLDAVPYLYEREGTNCENLPETHAFLRKLRAHVDEKFENRMLLAEANQWPEDAAAYFGEGDECHMNYHFPLMPRMFMALQMENNYPIVDILAQTPPVPPNCQWALFLRNHDELTLEMVTDEDRDYMYRVYAADPQARVNLGIRRRLAPLLQDRRQLELLNGLLFSLPGTPVLYYGDEIAMGDNIYLGDRDAVRTPMQWSGDRNAGFSRTNPQRLYLPPIIDPEYHYEAINVEAQQKNPGSFLWWMKRTIDLRKQHRVFGRGDISLLDPENPKVLAFIRTWEDQRVLVVANLSRFAQYAELDLAGHEGTVPVELFGGTEFPPIGPQPYRLSLGPHSFYWFELRHEAAWEFAGEGLPSLEVVDHWESLLQGKSKAALEEILPRFLRQRRWFRGKARELVSATIGDHISIPLADGSAQLVFVRAEYRTGPAETYVLPLLFAHDEECEWIEEQHAHALLSRVTVREASGTRQSGVLYDALVAPEFATALLTTLRPRKVTSGSQGKIVATVTKGFRDLSSQPDLDLTPRTAANEQTNTSIVYGDRFILKVFRLLEEGTNPEVEVGQQLTQGAGFEHTAPVWGHLSYEAPGLREATLGVIQGYVSNQGDAWQLTLDALGRFFERAVAISGEIPHLDVPHGTPLQIARLPVPPSAVETIGPYLSQVRLLAERTAELHNALAGDPETPSFAPESLTELNQRALYQSARTRLNQTFKLLGSKGQLERLAPELRQQASQILERQTDIDAQFRAIIPGRITAQLLRCHGDYHLGQVLYTGKDFVIIDFEGEPARSISERRFKRSPLVDVAGMLRSFHYAMVFALRHGTVRAEDVSVLEPWANFWHRWVSATFLGTYLSAVAEDTFLPKDDESLGLLIQFYLLEKCVYELGYELNHRPDWLAIPLQGLSELLSTPTATRFSSDGPVTQRIPTAPQHGREGN